jgi:hypothetical protein
MINNLFKKIIKLSNSMFKTHKLNKISKFKNLKNIIPQLDTNGLSIINYNFLKIKHKLKPWKR